MTTPMPRVAPGWLTLREPSDAAARTPELVDRARTVIADRAAPLVIHDLGCGTGSMGRWLAPRLPGPQHWVLHDRDADLLDLAAAELAVAAADGAPVTVQTRLGDATAVDFTGAALVTASALLDLLTVDEVDRLARACAVAGCPALLTLSVSGRVELSPAEPLDREIGAAFNDHQRRRVGPRQLLGPDAVAATAAAYGRFGLTTLVRPSPWTLGPDEGDLIGEWFDGWVAAAIEQCAELAARAADYIDRRRDQLAARELRVTVAHDDLFAYMDE
jgi:SAM-dependent methyltransferase